MPLTVGRPRRHCSLAAAPPLPSRGAGTSAAVVATNVGVKETSVRRCRCWLPSVAVATAEQPHCCRAAARLSASTPPNRGDGSAATATVTHHPSVAVSATPPRRRHRGAGGERHRWRHGLEARPPVLTRHPGVGRAAATCRCRCAAARAAALDAEQLNAAAVPPGVAAAAFATTATMMSLADAGYLGVRGRDSGVRGRDSDVRGLRRAPWRRGVGRHRDRRARP